MKVRIHYHDNIYKYTERERESIQCLNRVSGHPKLQYIEFPLIDALIVSKYNEIYPLNGHNNVHSKGKTY